MKTSLRIWHNDRRMGPSFVTQQGEGGTLPLAAKRAMDTWWSGLNKKQRNDVRSTPVVKIEIVILEN